MIVKINGQEEKFNNFQSEIANIFDYINKFIEEKNIFLISMRIDGIEIYDDYYEYILDNIQFIEEIVVKVQTLKDLIAGIIYSSLEYCVKAAPLIDNLSNSFMKSPDEKSWSELDNLFAGIGWMLESYSNIEQHKNLNELLSDYYTWNEYAVEIEKLKRLLPDFLEAVRNKDTGLIGDILEYEIVPLFNSMINILSKMAKEDVSTNNAN